MLVVKRNPKNPILKPDREHSWEAEAVFNGCPIRAGKKIYLLYRALSFEHFHSSAGASLRISSIGRGESGDGIMFKNRERLIAPENEWERYGCEDPRVTKLGSQYYIFYTAISNFPPTAAGIKVGLAISPDLKHVTEKHLITPFNAKAMTLFPEKINGKFYALLTADTDMPPSTVGIAEFGNIEEMWSENYWKKWYSNLKENALLQRRSPEDQMEIGAPPIKTEKGWLVIYSYIRHYFSPNKFFGIEAVLLDPNDPRKVIARTPFPLMAPEEEYEKYGEVPNTIFPSGALMVKNDLWIYYGAADSTVSVASVNLTSLLNCMQKGEKARVTFLRPAENPIISPNANNSWEASATFNPAAIFDGEKVHILYRAMSQDNTSVIGYASTRDGVHIDERGREPVYVPREDFEKKAIPGNSGCEDPRITKIGAVLYMCYTAYDGKGPPRVALSSIPWKKFLNKEWEWKKPVLISPPNIGDKNACIFPKKIKNKYLIMHRIGTEIDIACVKSLDFDGKTWLEEERWLAPRRGSWDSAKIGISGPPFETSKGWVLLYHGISEVDHVYRVGAVLMDLKDPTRIIGRTDHPIFEPETDYEKNGVVNNVVFPCGSVVLKGRLYLYYGGADKVVGVASIELKKLLGLFHYN